MNRVEPFEDTGEEGGGRSRLARLLSRRVGAMLVRNTVTSTGVFAISLGVLWLLVHFARMAEVPAAAIGFAAAQTVHYAAGRLWIYRGTRRSLGTGYLLFLASAAVGLAMTVSLYALMLEYTPLNYLVARVIVSVFAGLAMFLFNATLNFRRV